MPTQPAAHAAVAEIVCDAAPLIASALEELERPASVRFAYSTSGVTVYAVYPERLEEAFEALHAAFTSAGWGFTSRFALDACDERVSISFQPPHLQCRTDLPTVA